MIKTNILFAQGLGSMFKRPIHIVRFERDIFFVTDASVLVKLNLNEFIEFRTEWMAHNDGCYFQIPDVMGINDDALIVGEFGGWRESHVSVSTIIKLFKSVFDQETPFERLNVLVDGYTEFFVNEIGDLKCINSKRYRTILDVGESFVGSKCKTSPMKVYDAGGLRALVMPNKPDDFIFWVVNTIKKVHL